MNDPIEETKREELEGYEDPSLEGLGDYPIEELAIRDERRAAQDVVRRIEKGRYLLDPDFQRSFVWDIEKQSRLIESILMRIPLPVFYVAEDRQGNLVVVDGRQRLETLRRFLRGDFKLFLKNRSELNGKLFKDLIPKHQNRVEDCNLHFYIIDANVPDRARLDIFERVNSGEKLSRQQMRNALYNGVATMFLRKEAESDLFRNVTGNSLNILTMRDREFVNRFCSFYLLERKEYKGDMDEWLAKGLSVMSKLTEEEIEIVRSAFIRTLRNNQTIFNYHAFRKHTSITQYRRAPINAALFDILSTSLAEVEESLAISKAEEFRTKLYHALSDPIFEDSISRSTNSANAVKIRFSVVEKMINEVFDVNPTNT